MIEDDLGLEHSWTMMNMVKQTTCMTSLAFEHIAASNPKLTLVHNFPGLVESDNFRRLQPLEGAGLLKRIWVYAVKKLVGLLRFFIGMAPEEAGERQAFHLRSDAFSPGVWRVHQDSEPVPASKALKQYQGTGWPEKIWEFTTRTWDKALLAHQGQD